MLRLYNSLTKRTEEFEPADGQTALIYSCGPTVYDYPHIGNLRAFLVSDILCRWLRHLGYETHQVMNLTDVDDKTIAGAEREGVSLGEYTGQYEEAFFEDIQTLRIERAWKYPRATEHIEDMQNLVSTLVERGHAYERDGSVYFDVSSFDDYGKLSGVEPESEARDAAFGRLHDDEYDREQVHDFVLWKAQKEPDEPAWDSPWGPGRPGWHIECSTMAMRYLGPTLDIHTGGIDLEFPHHENEIAQSEGATGEQFVRFWVHSRHLLVDGMKMSKSLGNFHTLRDLMEKGYDPMAVRHQLMTAHYRKQLNFTFDGLEQSGAALERVYTFSDRLRKLPLEAGRTEHVDEIAAAAKDEFEAAMNDDLNVTGAMAAVFHMLRELNELIEDGELREGDRDTIFGALEEADSVLGFIGPALETAAEDEDEEIEALIAERDRAREEQDFERADEIRAELVERGIIVEDGPEGTIWRRKR